MLVQGKQSTAGLPTADVMAASRWMSRMNVATAQVAPACAKPQKTVSSQLLLLSFSSHTNTIWHILRLLYCPCSIQVERCRCEFYGLSELSRLLTLAPHLAKELLGRPLNSAKILSLFHDVMQAHVGRSAHASSAACEHSHRCIFTEMYDS